MYSRRTFGKVVVCGLMALPVFGLATRSTFAAPSDKANLEAHIASLRSQCQALQRWHNENKPKGFAAPVVHEMRAKLSSCMGEFNKLRDEYRKTGKNQELSHVNDCLAKLTALQGGLDRFEKAPNEAASKAAFVDCASLFASFDNTYKANVGKLRF